jgi:hypothetical protein
MSMSPRQLRQLEEIESELELSQPQLTAMFDMFRDLTSGERPNGAEQLTRRRSRWAPSAGGWSHVPRRPEVLGLLIVIMVVTLGVLFGSGPVSLPSQCLTASAQSQSSSAAVFDRSSMSATFKCPGYITSK